MVARTNALAALLSVVPRLSRFLGARLERSEPPLSLQQLYVLQRIAEGTKRNVDLARRAHVSGPTMSGILERLATLGVIRREPDPGDRRAVLVELTPRGRELLTARSAWLERELAELVAGAGPDEVAAIERACAALTAALDARVAAEQDEAARSGDEVGATRRRWRQLP